MMCNEMYMSYNCLWAPTLLHLYDALTSTCELYLFIDLLVPGLISCHYYFDTALRHTPYQFLFFLLLWCLHYSNIILDSLTLD
jgi:hypothetical protein